MAQPSPWVPTVNDLRVKLCYICREEEQYNDPQVQPTTWVHPCSCTLIAHESCLLEWIQSSQQDSDRANNALKCPQCSAQYELESDNPFALRLLNHLHSSLSLAGKVVTVCGITGVLVSCGFGLYIMLTSYGAYALQEYLGKEMYNRILTDDVSNWPWHAYFNLPLIPISLIAGRSQLFDSIPLFPLFLAWTSSPPVSPITLNTGTYPLQPLIRWPPSPLMMTLLFPVITGAYRSVMNSLRQWVMGTPPTELPPVRRIIWAINEGGPAQLRVRIAANLRDEPQPPRDRQRRARGQQRQDPARQEQNRNEQDNNDGEEGEGQANNPAAAAERTIRVTGGSLGRFVGGALLVPAIANRMGTLLFNISKRFSLLRKFLGIRPTYGVGLVRHALLPRAADGKVLPQLSYHLRVMLNVFFGGTKAWTDSDPVWWRNTVGLGMFVLAKDCLSLLHVYLTKREIETRRVKNRSFAGVDIRELDLINPPPS